MLGGILRDTHPKTITMILRTGFSSGPQCQSDQIFLVLMGRARLISQCPRGGLFVLPVGRARVLLQCLLGGQKKWCPAALDDVSLRVSGPRGIDL